MPTRRSFLQWSALSSLFPLSACTGVERTSPPDTVNKPIIVTTWPFGLAANEEAWKILSQNGRALDAVEAGARVAEPDPDNATVGYGGRPDRKGHVTLDACIMDENGRCGSVAFLEHIKTPTSVARLVMEKTPHVMLVGEGAYAFALENGFTREELLTPASEQAWKEWLSGSEGNGKAEINVENHDTIGLLALDASGVLSGACSTSGAAWKMHGRVGDSPLIGAGLYVDNAAGAACATGWGEAVIRAAGSFLVVELMRQGHDPEEACRLAVERVIEKNPDYAEIQVGFLALDRYGRFGAYCIQPGFSFAVYDQDGNRLMDAKSRL